MTHSNLRYGTREDLSNDYCILIMPANDINNKGAVPKLRELFDVLMENNPVNAGGIGIGTILTNTVEEIKANIDETTSILHAVYDDINVAADTVDDIKAKDFGFSVIMSGLLDKVDEVELARNVPRHSFEYALGVLGKTELLPPPHIRKVTSMCGHGFISQHLVEMVMDEVKSERITITEGARMLGKNCVCGIFNLKRAEMLLKEAIEH